MGTRSGEASIASGVSDNRSGIRGWPSAYAHQAELCPSAPKVLAVVALTGNSHFLLLSYLYHLCMRMISGNLAVLVAKCFCTISQQAFQQSVVFAGFYFNWASSSSSCLLPLLLQEIWRLTLEANRTADGVLALEKGIMSLQIEAREAESELQRKTSEIDAEATATQEVSL